MATTKQWRPNRNEARYLKALVQHLEAERESILTCCHRGYRDGKTVFEIKHPDGRHVMDIPASAVGATRANPNPRERIMDLVARIVADDYEGDLCEICTAKLLEGEEKVCSTCEAREVMGLLRLRDGLAE